MRIILTFILIISLITGDLFCQSRTVTGRIISEYFEPLPLIYIQDIDTTLIGKTDLDGRFKIEIPSSTDSLLLCSLGIEWATIQLTSDCDTLEVVMMYDYIYDFITLRKVDRLRLKRFKKLSEIHKQAFDQGLFMTETPCYMQEFETYFDK